MASRRKKIHFYECDEQTAVAFKQDCEEFLEEFGKLKSLKFSDFARIWQRKYFTLVFAGQKYALLLKELLENGFYIIKKCMMSSEDVFTRIGGLYLLYGLYYKQPLKNWVKIRLTLDEYKNITELIEHMRRQKQYDVVYVFAKMKVDQAFVYTALQRPLGPEDRFVKSCDVYLDYAFSTTDTENAIKKFNQVVQEDNLIKEIEKTNNEYQKLMKKYAAKCPGLVPFASNIVEDLRGACSELAESSKYVPCVGYVKMASSVKSRRELVKEKAATSKNAVYRGNREVITALNVDFVDRTMVDLDSDISDVDM